MPKPNLRPIITLAASGAGPGAADGEVFCLDAPAKINLFLEVLGKREDGFHDLETVMTPLRLADRVRFAARPANEGVRLEVVGPCAKTPTDSPIPADERNLVVKAVNALLAHTNTKHGAAIVLEKHVPAEAGLGGGSSDAAAALLLANHAWRLGLGYESLHAVAAGVGSDVPFFLSRGAAVCRGRGERVEPIAAPGGQPVVLVQPSFGLSTAAVYRALAGQPGQPGQQPTRTADSLIAGLRRGDWREVANRQFNRLQTAARRVANSIDTTLNQLEDSVRLRWMMTGSGSALFALSPSMAAATRAAAVLGHRGVGWSTATRIAVS